MEWRELLVKYMSLVISEEGVDYLAYGYDTFTELELAALRDISAEAGGMDNA